MGKIIKKRQILAATLVIALAAAVTVNWYYTKSAPKTGAGGEGETPQMLGDSLLVAGTAVDEENGKEAPDGVSAASEEVAAYFSEMQLKQREARDAIENEIETILAADALDEQAEEKVLSLLNTLTDNSKAQTDCETLIKAKIGGAVLVILNGDSAQVIVDAGRLNAQSTLQISEIMETNAAISAENLTILEAKS